MGKKIKVDDLPEFDMAQHLDSEQAIADYLNVVIAEGDPSELAHALGTIAKARGMTQLAVDTGIGRESLYKALRSGASPRWETISKVCEALGVRLVAQPIGTAQA